MNEVIILVGGMGTRLNSVIPNLPKPLAPIGSKPFLAKLLDHLELQGFSNVILSVGYLHQKIIDYFGNKYGSININYCIEHTLLGTGGAIAKSIELTSTNPILVLNGDTLFKINYSTLMAAHDESNRNITIGLKELPDVEGFGTVKVKNNKIISFEEKLKKGSGLINTGVYVVNREIFIGYEMPAVFSFEKDFLSQFVHDIKPTAYISDGYFIDIGVPESYKRAVDEATTDGYDE